MVGFPLFFRRRRWRGLYANQGHSTCRKRQIRAPRALDAIIDTTPAWRPVVEALANLKPGGRLVINAIRKQEDDKQALLDLSCHEHLWLEKEVKTIANITRRDIADFLPIAARVPLEPRVEIYPLAQANRALLELKQGKVHGAKVLQIG
jgi:propanol-preferring alcohol dehydrogenase